MMTTCETCDGEGVLLCEGPYCTDNSHDEPCKDCEGSGERMDKHNCPGLSACVSHPKVHVFKLFELTEWRVWPTGLFGRGSSSHPTFEEALAAAHKLAKEDR